LARPEVMFYVHAIKVEKNDGPKQITLKESSTLTSCRSNVYSFLTISHGLQHRQLTLTRQEAMVTVGHDVRMHIKGSSNVKEYSR